MTDTSTSAATDPVTDGTAGAAAASGTAEARAVVRGRRRAQRRMVALLALAALAWAVLTALDARVRIGVADLALDADLDAQRARVASLALRTAAARSGDARARDELAVAAALPGEARRTLARLESVPRAWGEPISLEPPAVTLDAAWRDAATALEGARDAVDALVELALVVERFEADVARLLADSAQLGDALVGLEAEPAQVRAATRQLLLAQRLESSARRLLADRDGLLGTADRLGRDAIVFGEINNALLNGNPGLGLERVEDLDARALLERIGRRWREATAEVERIVGLAASGAEAGDALVGLDASLAALTSALETLVAAVERARTQRRLTPEALRMGLGLVVLALLLGALAASRRSRAVVEEARARREREVEHDEAIAAHEAREAESEAREQRTAEALAALAAGLKAWSRGALAAPVEGLEGLSDELESALGAVREGLAPIVEELRESGLQLGSSSSAARGAASRVARMADDQRARIDALARSALEATASLEPLAEGCAAAAERAGRDAASLSVAAGDVRTALASLAEARAAVGDTAGRVARAGDELAVLRDLAESLDELSDQSKLLSVNVAIQGSMDTESGRALANFADEVQRVSERARQAVRRMESADALLTRLLGEAVEAVKRGRWALDSASESAARAEPALGALDRLAAEALELQPALDDAARAHTVEVAEVVRGLKAVQSLAVEIRASAFAASDTSARVETTAHRVARAAERLDPDAGGVGEIVEIGRGIGADARADEHSDGQADERGAGNVHALRPPEPPAGS